MSVLGNNLLDAMKDYFRRRSDVAFAFLFGSQEKGYATDRSDADIAVYFVPRNRAPIEFESDFRYEGEDGIWTDMERLLGREVDLVVLNRAPAAVAAAALRGAGLAINDSSLHIDFLLAVTDEADRFMDLVIGDFRERNGVGQGR